MSLNDLVNLHFRCAITMVRPTMPMICPCGHLFDAPAIYLWLSDHPFCPVSRLPLTPEKLRFESVINQFLNDINQTDDDLVTNSTQTDAPMVVEQAESISTQTDTTQPLIQPFVALVNEPVGASQLPLNERRYLGNDLLVDLGVSNFNPSSSNLRLLPVVDHLNNSYVRNRIPFRCTHPHVVIRKYVYQHSSDSIVEVAKLLARQGYYIYDLFIINKTNGLNRFVLYSCDVRDDGSDNNLSRFKSIQSRLT